MTKHTRRDFLGAAAKIAGTAAVAELFPAAIQRALAAEPGYRTGTILDVEHIVILTQENRSFDHYFGAMGGVRGFADPFPIPVPDALGIHRKNVWIQPNASLLPFPPAIAPFHLNTTQHFEYMRVEGTAHSWVDAQIAWSEGRLNRWTVAKQNHSLGYFSAADIPFQWALANAFTICDAYHCAIHAGTNPNRLFLFTGTNDPLAAANGPATYNDYDWFNADPGHNGGYAWVTYAERLEKNGVSWQVYEDMADNFTDNPLAGFHAFRDAWLQRPGYSQALRDRGVSTRPLEALAEDVLAGRLPQVSWIVAPAEGSEHPGPSSPAQGADYTARVLDALTANPETWSKTVFIVNFDENDGFFDHVPPPAPPSYVLWRKDPSEAVLAGASTVDTAGEYHEHLVNYHASLPDQALLHRPYGLGPRVPLYVISPWTKGGWVNSQVFDHTSVLRFLEARFGVQEPNISAWRRAVCGDLTSAFNFAQSDVGPAAMPETLEIAQRARALSGRTTPPTPSRLALPVQDAQIRKSRALPYELHVTAAQTGTRITLALANTGAVAAVFHVYDRRRLSDLPRRYTVEAGKLLYGSWSGDGAGVYDLWVLGPNGFHRHFTGKTSASADPAVANPDIGIAYAPKAWRLVATLSNSGGEAIEVTLVANRYYPANPTTHEVPAHGLIAVDLALENGPWYDFSLSAPSRPGFLRRFAGRIETGADSFSDPAMDGKALGDQWGVPS